MSDGVSAAEYHERTKLPPADGRNRPDPENRPRDHKAYRDVPQQPLANAIRPPQVPTLDVLAGDPPRPDDVAARSGVDLDALSVLCHYAAGVMNVVEDERGTFRFRAASCTGALYHVDLYPVVGPDGPVPAGVYHFDPLSRSLDVLREGDFRDVLAEAAGGHIRIGDAPVTFVATSTWWRNAWKYAARTYRHAFWDSGTVLANLLATATALDLPAEVVLGFADERVADLLGVDTEEEAPLELVPVGAGSRRDGETRATGGGERQPTSASEQGVERSGREHDAPTVDPLDLDTESLSPNPREFPLIHEAYVGSSLPDGEAVRDWREPPVSDRLCASSVTQDGRDERTPLDPVGPGRASKAPLPAAIRRRRSHREYVADPLNFRKFSTILDRAIRHQPIDVLGGDAPLQLNDCYLVVNAVEGVEPGSYQYHPTAGELELLEAGEFREKVTGLALGQAWGGEAAVAVYFMTDLDAVAERLGERGYRAAQLEGALVGGRLYLACYSHRDVAGLGLTFFDDEVTEFFSPRAAEQTPTFHYVFGTPA